MNPKKLQKLSPATAPPAHLRASAKVTKLHMWENLSVTGTSLTVGTIAVEMAQWENRGLPI